MKKIWIDTETTGLNAKNISGLQHHQIIELAAICDDRIFHMYCKPKVQPYNYSEIEEITGITWEFLEENGVSEAELYQKFVSFLDRIVDRYDKTDKLMLSGYNTKFDSEFIRSLFLKNNNTFYGSYFFSLNYEVMSEVAFLLVTEILPLLPNYKLETVCKEMGIKFKAHSAIEDIKATIKLNDKIQEKRREWIKEEEKQTKDTEIPTKKLIM